MSNSRREILREAAKAKKAKQQKPQTVDDVFEEAIEQEESGDRWRLDPEKCYRFYDKASKAYDEYLAAKPNDFDAWFNKARLYLNMVSNCDMLSSKSNQYLQSSIDLHQKALSLETNSEAYFNLAQTHKYLAENSTESGYEQLALPHIQAALDACMKCSVLQQEEFLQKKLELEQIFFSGTANIDFEKFHANVSQADEDSAVLLGEIAALAAGTSSFMDSDYENLSQLVQSVSEKYDVLKFMDWHLAREKRLVLSGQHSEQAWVNLLQVYDDRLSQLPELNLQNPLQASNAPTKPIHIQLLCDKADAFVDFAETLIQAHMQQSSTPSVEVLTRAWNIYGQAAKALKLASTYDGSRTRIWISRADLEIQRTNIPLAIAENSKSVLLNNAKVMYERAYKETQTRKTTRTFYEIVVKHEQLQTKLGIIPVTCLAVIPNEAKEDILESL
ncbi:TPR repeat protein [Schizosaccharomyces osmophilus]|uniref:TPR repeat protein n=1 Tax=Schizosaccharomyces osmophilus TaxID=2545709 RepID=A0AAF0AZK9_9SCHI|nr:TPR repeat protein [Schizosaccharomyces osmophilus]WBW75213.1 TPR repeat protein [Schizosaccharomyces osmophilus]